MKTKTSFWRIEFQIDITACCYPNLQPRVGVGFVRCVFCVFSSHPFLPRQGLMCSWGACSLSVTSVYSLLEFGLPPGRYGVYFPCHGAFLWLFL